MADATSSQDVKPDIKPEDANSITLTVRDQVVKVLT
jgi:hypothetical protein